MEKNRVATFFKESEGKFTKKRQASKYLNEMGSVWKTEQNIPLTSAKRGTADVTPTPKSLTKKVKKGKKK